MIERFQVGTLAVALTYQFDTFLRHTLGSFRLPIDAPMRFLITSHIVDMIDLPFVAPFYQQGSLKFYQQGDQHTIVGFTKQGEPFQRIDHDEKYHHSTLRMHHHYIANLAQQEYVFLGTLFMALALHEGYLPLHASAINYQGEGLGFVAPSQTGKSTHARLWIDHFPSISYINDDKPLVRLSNNQFTLLGSPFAGSSLLQTNVEVPLKALVFLTQSPTNQIRRLPADEAITWLLRNILRPQDQLTWQSLTPLLDKLIKTIPCYHLAARPDAEAFETVYNTIYPRR